MRLLQSSACLAALAVLMLAGSAQAQYGYGGYGYGRPPMPPPDYDDEPPPPRDYYYERRRPDYDRPPPRDYGGGFQARGGFVQSCSDIQQNGFYLEATCQRKGGGSNRSRIDVRQCRSIGNNNGRLVCE